MRQCIADRGFEKGGGLGHARMRIVSNYQRLECDAENKQSNEKTALKGSSHESL
jgi:hypothetical protein